MPGSPPVTTIDRAKLVVFRLGEQRFALPLEAVERIVRAAEVTPLLNAPSIVLGMIQVESRVLPVLNVRRRFRLPEREIQPADQFLIALTSTRAVVLVIDEAQGVIECPPSEMVSAASVAPGLEQVQGVAKLDDGLVLIHDLEKFLSLDESSALDEVMSEERR